jgi:formylglycine-generating enzyme required for sulfatase activity
MKHLTALLALMGCGSSSPPLPNERASIVVPPGEAWTLASSCRPNWTPNETREHVGSFNIDRDEVTCDEWKACVTAHACEDRKLEECRDQVAVVRRRGAAAFCTWRGRRLPTLAEWSRGARGDSKTFQQDTSKSCTKVALQSEKVSRCPYLGPTGMRFSLLGEHESEWTSEDDCTEANDGNTFEVAVGGGDPQLIRVQATVAAFRCVVAAK